MSAVTLKLEQLRPGPAAVSKVTARRVCLFYALIASVWVVGSDGGLFLAGDYAKLAFVLSMGKGLAFVAVTGLALYFFMTLWARESIFEREALRLHFAHFGGLANDAILAADGRGRIIEVNGRASEVYGWSREELLRLELRDIEAGRSDWDEAWRRLLRQGQEVREAIHLRADGSCLPVEVSTRVEVAGEQALVSWSVRDISERREFQEQLSRANRGLREMNAELERFAFLASHDLREPVRLILSFAQLLERQSADRLSAEDREPLSYIIAAAHRMDFLTAGLRAYVALGDGSEPLHPVSAEAAFQRCLDALATELVASDAVLELGPLPQVMGNEEHLALLFQHLIDNAIKFRKPDQPPHILIAVERRGEEWYFTVGDNGIGISETDQDIFELFRRLHAGDEYQGSGVGLALCKRVVLQHGGTIGVESQEGEGARFHFTLRAVPLHPEGEKA